MRIHLLLCLLLLMFLQVTEAEFSVIIQQELTVDDHFNSQKFETLLEPEWNFSISDNTDVTIIARARWDSLNNLGPRTDRPISYSSANGAFLSGSDGEIAIRELYIDTVFLDSFWRIGKQQVVWGQADGLKVLDVVNPQSFREFILDDFEDSRIPLWMVNVELALTEDSSLQLLWVPDTSYNELAESNTTYEIISPLLVPQLEDGHSLIGFNQRKPSSIFSDSDFGMRYSLFYSGWDFTFNYMYHYHDAAVLYQNIAGSAVVIDSNYERTQLFGASASNSFGEFTLRSEIGYSTNNFNLSTDLKQSGIHESAHLSSVIGLDWQGLENTLVSAQWFSSHLFDYDDSVIRSQDNHILSFLYKRTFQNETWGLDVLNLHNLNIDDGSIQAKLNYTLISNVDIWVGTDVFYGKKTGLFGQFKNVDRITFGIKWGL